MRALMDELKGRFAKLGWEPVCPPLVQTMAESELEAILPTVDGWITGDDPVNERTLTAGKAGRLRAVVKWGVGTDSVDFEAAERLGFAVQNTPGVFGEEVADLTLGYIIALARQTFQIDRGVRSGKWPKPQGRSLRDLTVALVGFGSIGKAAAARCAALGMQLLVYDPYFQEAPGMAVEHRSWPDGLDQADFLVLTCPLTKENHHMINAESLALAKPGVYIVNVARGPLIDEQALVAALREGSVAGAALDVFENEPLPADSPLLVSNAVILGSHNASNTLEGARRATEQAIQHMHDMLVEVQA
jgi:D-3-phosphoglycerate dehydrogenase / 2-oxoglutarate reductase